MEIEGRNISYSYKGKKLLHDVSFHFASPGVYGIIGEYKTLLLEVMDLTKKYQGQLMVNGELIERFNVPKYRRKIALIGQTPHFFTTTVQKEMQFVSAYYNYQGKDLKKRMMDALKMVGLEESYLQRKISTLSSGEKILLSLSCNILLNPHIILFDDIFSGLDYNYQKMLLNLIQKLVSRKNKIIVIASNNVDFLYSYTDNILVLDKGSVVKFDKTEKILKDIPFLKKHDLDIPNIVEFTHLANEHHAGLHYHKDILDLIKDVYKHV